MRINNIYNKTRYLVLAVVQTLSISAFSQSLKDSISTPLMGEVDGTLHSGEYRGTSLLFGVGGSNVLDTYLSPYSYTGIEARLLRATMRPTHLMDGHIHYQTLLEANLAYLENKSKTANEYVGALRYSAAWMYQFTQHPSSFTVMAGLQPSAHLGGIYNTRNGNNPAEAKADITVNATALATYRLHLFGTTIPLQYQLTVPLIGAAFAINYGQSYYEAFALGNYDHNIVFVHPFNTPSLRHLLTVDIPVRHNYLRLGWCGEFDQSKYNGIRYHSYSNNFMIGYNMYWRK